MSMRTLIETRGVLFEAKNTRDLLAQISTWYEENEGEVTLGCIVFDISSSDSGDDYSESAAVYFE